MSVIPTLFSFDSVVNANPVFTSSKIRPELVGPLLDPESGLSLVSLPSLGAMLDQTQARLTQRILDMLGQGFLEVTVSGPVVCGKRGGDCRVFWSYCKFDQNKTPQEVSKLPCKPLYFFREFIRGQT